MDSQHKQEPPQGDPVQDETTYKTNPNTTQSSTENASNESPTNATEPNQESDNGTETEAEIPVVIDEEEQRINVAFLTENNSDHSDDNDSLDEADKGYESDTNEVELPPNSNENPNQNMNEVEQKQDGAEGAALDIDRMSDISFSHVSEDPERDMNCVNSRLSYALDNQLCLDKNENTFVSK